MSTLVGTQKVAHVCNNYLPLTNTFIYSFLKNMRTYQPVVLANALSNVSLFPLRQVFLIPHSSIVNRAVDRVARMGDSFHSSLYRHYREILDREGPVLIHAHFGETGFRALELSKGHQVPLITSFYGADLSLTPRKWYWRKAYRKLFSGGDFFLTFSNKMRSMLVELGCPAEKIASCPAGVEASNIPFKPRALGAGEEIRILLCNRFVEKKGTEYAVRAFAMLQSRVARCRLAIIGDGPLKGDLEALVSRLKLDPFVDFLGMLPHRQVIDELLKAHIFLSPSVQARDGDDEGGINYIVVEAAATGISLIVTEHASSEVVVDGLSGLIIKERDQSDLFEKLLLLVERPMLWEALGREARRLAESQFDASTQTEKLEGIYTELISRKRVDRSSKGGK